MLWYTDAWHTANQKLFAIIVSWWGIPRLMTCRAPLFFHLGVAMNHLRVMKKEAALQHQASQLCTLHYSACLCESKSLSKHRLYLLYPTQQRQRHIWGWWRVTSKLRISAPDPVVCSRNSSDYTRHLGYTFSSCLIGGILLCRQRSMAALQRRVRIIAENDLHLQIRVLAVARHTI